MCKPFILALAAMLSLGVTLPVLAETDEYVPFISPTEVISIPPAGPFSIERHRQWRADLVQFKEAILTNHLRFWDDQVIFLPRGFDGREAGDYGAWNQQSLNLAIAEQFSDIMAEVIDNVHNLTDFELPKPPATTCSTQPAKYCT